MTAKIRKPFTTRQPAFPRLVESRRRITTDARRQFLTQEFLNPSVDGKNVVVFLPFSAVPV